MHSKFLFKYGSVLLLFFLVFPAGIFAGQTVLLRNGGKIVGTVVSQNEKAIVIQSEDGKKSTIGKREILKIVYKEIISKEEENKIRKEAEQTLKENPKEEVIIKEEPIVKEPSPTTNLSGRSRWSAVWRSALLPGWGQWYTGNKAEAKLTLGGFGTALALGIYTRIEEDSAKKDYDAAVSRSSITGAYILGGGIANFYLLTVVPGARSDYDKSVHMYNDSIYLLGSVYVAQLVRSYFLGKAWENDAGPNPIAWTVSPKPDFGMGRLGWGAEASVTIGF